MALSKPKYLLQLHLKDIPFYLVAVQIVCPKPWIHMLLSFPDSLSNGSRLPETEAPIIAAPFPLSVTKKEGGGGRWGRKESFVS